MVPVARSYSLRLSSRKHDEALVVVAVGDQSKRHHNHIPATRLPRTSPQTETFSKEETPIAPLYQESVSFGSGLVV